MIMSMRKAFNKKFLSELVRYNLTKGYYDNDNVWVVGTNVPTTFFGVLVSGNKFSQFDVGISLQNEVGGARYSDYKTLSIVEEFAIDLEDKVEHKGIYYNVLQMSDESGFGFRKYLLEKSKDWTP